MPIILAHWTASDGHDARVELDSGEVLTYHMHKREPESEEALLAEVEVWAAAFPADEPELGLPEGGEA